MFSASPATDFQLDENDESEFLLFSDGDHSVDEGEGMLNQDVFSQETPLRVK